MSGKSVAAGQIIVSSEVWVWSFEWHQHQTHCAFCFRNSANLRSCQGCQLYRYCNAECQRADWKKEHKCECDLLKRVRDYRQETETYPEVHRMARMMRLASGIQGDTSQTFATSSIILLKIINKIMKMTKESISGYDEKLSAGNILEMFPSVLTAVTRKLEFVREKMFQGLLKAAFPELVAKESLWPEYLVAETLTKIDLHQHAIINYDGGRPFFFGMGLFPAVPNGLLDEACSDQNAVVLFNGRTLLLYAVDDIPNYTGLDDVQLCDLREFPFRWPVKQRREMYADKFGGAECTCRKCTKEYEAIINPLKCATKGCTERIPSDDRALEPCAQCGAINEVNLRKLQTFRDKHEEDFSGYLAMWLKRDCHAIMPKKFPLWKELEKANILQPEAQLRFVLGWDVARSCDETGRHQEAWEIYRHMIVCLRNIAPRYSFYRAQFLREASTSIVYLGMKFMMMSKTQKTRLVSLLLDAFPLAIDCMKEARDTYSTLCGQCVITKDIAEALEMEEMFFANVVEFSKG
ncbi:uncharacterized protein LOC129585311 isoform X2 [Paramacrobiotus metropolitanus]|nr:uncharacterized protein LOC129585311 isoform X2 [Paramacrobiotus metropolitanus]XP_055333924.1 uncharacterized protein LOC129585311 isoform X2 [Paramacrobiotus metropolitanus]XP_055333925.1 uncharacterized protein LOC129585311 isoform X2 [Paramacrobiotus metropolitanus]XP_055333926.1 uncharacterized protein LOC129585311 isoform X2 [Paramacrobiotus metropolitanus]